MTIKYEILNRYTKQVQATADIECDQDADDSVKLGLAVQWCVKNGVSLSEADLKGADLRGANLYKANLSEANLRGANLSEADLRRANLSWVDLRRANLSWVDLSRANLNGATFDGANLSGANLDEANLSGADLREANFQDVKQAPLIIARTRILPEGSIIGWKRCANDVIVKLRIPEEARRSHAFGRKCRAEFADVLDVIGANVGVSLHDDSVKYRKGKRITPDGFDFDWTNECSHGIHFYITREEAEEYGG